MVGAVVDYTTAWGVPSLRGWYASGDDRNPLNGSERPVGYAGGGISKSGANTFFSSDTNLGGNMMLYLRGAVAGTWGLSLLWNGASFLPDLSHNFSVSYIQGTNNRNMAPYANPRFIPAYLTTKDSVVAVNLESLYKIYPNMHYIFEMTYMFQNLDGETWARGIAPATLRTPGVEKLRFSNAWRIGMNFRYIF
jgi:hypothetical protein